MQASAAIVILFASIFALSASAQVTITEIGVPITENFDSLPSTGVDIPFENNLTLPGWYSTRQMLNANSGSSSAATNYSFGRPPVLNERAFGTIVTAGLPQIHQGILLQNMTGMAIRSFVISFNGEQWRRANTPQQSILFSFDQFKEIHELDLTGAASTSVPELDFAGPIYAISGSPASIDGNLPENRRSIIAPIVVEVPHGEFVFLRWSRIYTGATSHGLAIDDVSITPRAQPTVAVVGLAGRVLTAHGVGISGTTVTVEGDGKVFRTRTGTFGAFRVEGLTAGRTYIVSVSNRKFAFAEPSRVVTPNSDVTEMTFRALEQAYDSARGR